MVLDLLFNCSVLMMFLLLNLVCPQFPFLSNFQTALITTEAVCAKSEENQNGFRQASIIPAIFKLLREETAFAKTEEFYSVLVRTICSLVEYNGKEQTCPTIYWDFRSEHKSI